MRRGTRKTGRNPNAPTGAVTRKPLNGTRHLDPVPIPQTRGVRPESRAPAGPPRNAAQRYQIEIARPRKHDPAMPSGRKVLHQTRRAARQIGKPTYFTGPLHCGGLSGQPVAGRDPMYHMAPVRNHAPPKASPTNAAQHFGNPTHLTGAPSRGPIQAASGQARRWAPNAITTTPRVPRLRTVGDHFCRLAKGEITSRCNPRPS